MIDIYTQFEHMFPSLAAGVTHWGPFKRNPNGIKLEMASGKVLIFLYYGENQWLLAPAQNSHLKQTSR